MKTPNSGDIFTKEDVLNTIISHANAAYSDRTDDYSKLRDLFESCFGFTVDVNLRYDKETNRFIVWEDTNYN